MRAGKKILYPTAEFEAWLRERGNEKARRGV
jgi:hypothetical protein